MKKGTAKSLVYRLFIGLVILVGMGLLAYPSVSNWYNDVHRTRAIADYREAATSMSRVDLDAMRLKAHEYNESLRHKTDRFRPTDAELADYMQTLDVTGTGIMGYIEIPCIDVELPVYHTVEETVLQIAAGHMPGSSLPIGETGSHVVLSGHRGLPSARLFTHLDKVQVGDKFLMHVLDETFTYEVYDIDIVLPEEMDSLSIKSDGDLVTLVTCTPYGVNSHRILVHGERVPNDVVPEDGANIKHEDNADSHDYGYRFDIKDDFGLVLIAVFLVLMAGRSAADIIRKSKKRKKQD